MLQAQCAREDIFKGALSKSSLWAVLVVGAIKLRVRVRDEVDGTRPLRLKENPAEGWAKERSTIAQVHAWKSTPFGKIISC